MHTVQLHPVSIHIFHVHTTHIHASSPLNNLISTTAPKAAREEYESYLAAVAGLLGGDLPSEELQEGATQVCACVMCACAWTLGWWCWCWGDWSGLVGLVERW